MNSNNIEMQNKIKEDYLSPSKYFNGFTEDQYDDQNDPSDDNGQ